MDKQTNQNTVSKDVFHSANAPGNLTMPVSRTTLCHQLAHTGMYLLWKYKAIGLLGIGLFFAVGVPLIINELYKHLGYVTMWSAADVLSYYGAVLGASITVGTLAITILFTRKQILRESYLENRKESWSKIDEVFTATLKSINPIPPIKESIESDQKDISEIIKIFRSYQMSCQMAVDEVIPQLNSEDYLKVKELIDQMIITSNQCFRVTEEELVAYSKLQNLNGRKDAQQTLETETKHPGSFPAPILAFCRDLLQNTDGLAEDIIWRDIVQINKKLIDVYENSYRPLLAQKRDVFEKIDNEVQKEADSILHLWRK